LYPLKLPDQGSEVSYCLCYYVMLIQLQRSQVIKNRQIFKSYSFKTGEN